MKQVKKTAKIAVIVLTAVSIALIVGGFFVPPMGVIDGSVLTACGILFAFAALFVAGDAIERGIDAKVTHKDTTIELTND